MYVNFGFNDVSLYFKRTSNELKDLGWQCHDNEFRTQNISLGVSNGKMVMSDLKSI